MNTLDMERSLSLPLAPEIANNPEIAPELVFDVMGEGYTIEKDPTPIAQITVGNAASAEAVMAKMAELSDRMDGEPAAGERFKSLTLADLQAELESIEFADKPETDVSFIEELPESNSLVRPHGEDEAKISGEDEGSKQDRNLLLGLRRSRLGRGVATASLVAAGALSWASSASAGGRLKDICAPSIFNKGTVLESEMHNPGKNNQHTIISIHVNEVDPRCDGAFKRVISVRPQIKHRGQSKWINESIYIPIYNGDTSEAEDIGGLFYDNPRKKPSRFYLEGSRVRFQQKIQQKNEVTGKIVRTKVFSRSVTVIGG